jgi:hypothetical protein
MNSNFTDSDRATVRCVGLLTGLPYDYLTKVYGVATLGKSFADRLPLPKQQVRLEEGLLLRTLRLNCLLSAYSAIWQDLYDPVWMNDNFVSANDATVGLGDIASEWTEITPLRTDYDRWLAMCEIDAIAALLLGLTMEQLLQMYRSQFAVLRKYETVTVFDGNGRQISGDYHAHGFLQAEWETSLKAAPARRGEKSMGMWDRVNAHIRGDTSVDLGPFVAPFRPADRESAMSRAYRAFAERVKVAS